MQRLITSLPHCASPDPSACPTALVPSPQRRQSLALSIRPGRRTPRNTDRGEQAHLSYQTTGAPQRFCAQRHSPLRSRRFGPAARQTSDPGLGDPRTQPGRVTPRPGITAHFGTHLPRRLPTCTFGTDRTRGYPPNGALPIVTATSASHAQPTTAGPDDPRHPLLESDWTPGVRTPIGTAS